MGVVHAYDHMHAHPDRKDAVVGDASPGRPRSLVVGLDGQIIPTVGGVWVVW